MIIANVLRWGSVPVPWTVMWSAEAPMHLAPCRFAEDRIALCNAIAPSEGKPVFGKPHMQRQRQAIVEERCDLCGKPLRGRTKVSLSHASLRHGAESFCIMQVEPMLHRECAVACIEHCPSLKRDIDRGTLFVRQVNRYRVQLAMLTSAATLEFVGKAHPGAVGHAKIELLSWRDRDAEWLSR